eukprot:jgi/Tetstr1/444076/TSEL_003316.t1
MLEGGGLLGERMLNPSAGRGAGMDVVRRRARSPRPQRPQEIYDGAVKELAEAERSAAATTASSGGGNGGRAPSRDPSPQRRKSAEGIPRASLTKLKHEGWGAAAARRPSLEGDPLSQSLLAGGTSSRGETSAAAAGAEPAGPAGGRRRSSTEHRRSGSDASRAAERASRELRGGAAGGAPALQVTGEATGSGDGGAGTGGGRTLRRITSAPSSPKGAAARAAGAAVPAGPTVEAGQAPPSRRSPSARTERGPSAGPSRLRYQAAAAAGPEAGAGPQVAVPRPPQASPPSSDAPSASREGFRRSKYVRTPREEQPPPQSSQQPPPQPPRLRLHQPPAFPRPTSASSDIMVPSPKAAPASRPAQFLVDAVRSKDDGRLGAVIGNLRGGSPRGPVIGINDRHPVTGRTALHEAVALGRLSLVTALLGAGADTEVGHATQGAPLLHAAAWGEASIVSALLSAGAALEARDCAAYTALHYAAVGGHAETAAVLLAAGADPAATNEDGRTAAELASGEAVLAALEGRTPPKAPVAAGVRAMPSFEIPESWTRPPEPPATAPGAGAPSSSGRPRSGRRLTGPDAAVATPAAGVTSPGSEDLSPPPRLRLPTKEQKAAEELEASQDGDEDHGAPPLPRCASPSGSPTSGSASSVSFSPFSAGSAATPPTGNNTPKVGAMQGAPGGSPFKDLAGPPGSGGLAGYQHLRGNFRPSSSGNSRGVGSPMARETANRVASGLGVNSAALQHQAAQMFYQSVEVITGDIAWTRGELLGEGAYGRVYAGLNQLSGELMAVKVLPLEVGNGLNPDEQRAHLQSLEHELSLYRRFQHRHIVGYIAAHMDYKTNTMYMFLEYVPGGSIAQMLERFSAFTEDLTRNFTRQLLLGLEYLHGCKVIHRDLKGGNVLVTRDGRVKLADFGASKAYHEATITDGMKSIRGSVFWMAPEVIKGTGYGRRADIWSVGCTVIEMLTGKHPWPELGDSHWSAMFQIAKTTTGPPIPDCVSAVARDFLGLCFRVDPAQRPTASELLQHPFVAHIPNAFRAAEEARDLNHSL